MAARKCNNCSASVPTDEQFCPNCGAFIDPLTPDDRSNVISVSSSGFERFDLKEPPPQERQPAAKPPRTVGEIQCPSCGAINPSSNRHCEECGARLSQAPLPTAPRPAVQANAGVRAALGISGLLFAVVIGALLFNVFGGEENPTETTVGNTTTTSPTVAENSPIPVIGQTCTPPEEIGTFICANLTSATPDQYQVNWEEIPEGEKIKIRLTFAQPMIVQQILWTGITDPTKFEQNYRARGLVITGSDSLAPYSFELQDIPGQQVIPFGTVGANWIEIEIQSAFNATPVEGNVFRELAIDEITAIGRPAASTSSSSSTTTTTGAP